MKIPKYPLQDVIMVKQQRVDTAEKVLQEKVKALQQEQQKLAEKEAERNKVLVHKDEKLFQLRQELDHGTTTAKIQQMKAYLKVVAEKLVVEEKKVTQQKEQVKKADSEVESARQDLRVKRLEVDKLDMHHKDWLKKMQKELEIHQEREHDEIGNITYLLHQRVKKNL